MPLAANLYRFGIYEAGLRSGELRKNSVRLKLRPIFPAYPGPHDLR